MIKKLFLLTAIPALLYSCGPIHFETGRSFTMAQIEAVKKGVTTKEDIRELFGEPRLTGKSDAGLEMWSYLYIRAEVPLKGATSKETFQRTTVTFEKDRVKSISYEMSP
ncbi:MAG: outer membrane protein assembly factor BamE [bacterium]|nr:outer membrane protein assembly factor BamE [bacterium]